MTFPWRVIVWVVAVALGVLATAATRRVIRVNEAMSAIPVYPGLREGARRTRLFPQLLAWDDRSSARAQRVFAAADSTSLLTIARTANRALGTAGWYLVAPTNLDHVADASVVIWQRDPDERLDLTKLWPIPDLSRTQRLYGGMFPPEFLDAPLVVEWSWALGGSRSRRPAPPHAARASIAPRARPPER